MKLFRLWAILLLTGFIIVNCNDSTPKNISDDMAISDRPVATVYETTTKVNCRDSVGLNSNIVFSLSKGQLVDLASSIDGAVKEDGYYWVHVYPRLSQQPRSCYIAARYLIPRQ